MIDESIEATVQQISLAADLEQKAILEVGCGNGRITTVLAQKAEA